MKEVPKTTAQASPEEASTEPVTSWKRPQDVQGTAANMEGRMEPSQPFGEESQEVPTAS